MTAINYVRNLAGGRVAAAHGYRACVLQARWPGGLKPRSPLLACACVGLKPPSPLLVKIGVFGAVFGSRGDAGFSGALFGGEQWCCWFHRRHVCVSCARIFSPCSSWYGCEREIVRPAHSKHSNFGVFGLAGRVFLRRRRWRGPVGRVFSRQPPLRRSWMQRGAVHVGGCGGLAALGADCQRVGGVSRF